MMWNILLIFLFVFVREVVLLWILRMVIRVCCCVILVMLFLGWVRCWLWILLMDILLMSCCRRFIGVSYIVRVGNCRFKLVVFLLWVWFDFWILFNFVVVVYFVNIGVFRVFVFLCCLFFGMFNKFVNLV